MSTKKDITGQRFNRLVAVKPQGRNLWGDSLWLCQCDCGNQKIVKYGLLASGKTGSCGCFNREQTRKANLVDLTGKRFGRLLVVKLVGTNKHSKALWLCRCDCGNERTIIGGNLASGITQSCGCFRTETKQARSRENHYRFNKEISEEERRLKRAIPGYSRWTRSVKKLANYTCQICNYVGAKGDGALVSHHLYSYKNYPKLRTAISNGICLCGHCHYCFHSRYGTENNTYEQFVEFLKMYLGRLDHGDQNRN